MDDIDDEFWAALDAIPSLAPTPLPASTSRGITPGLTVLDDRIEDDEEFLAALDANPYLAPAPVPASTSRSTALTSHSKNCTPHKVAKASAFENLPGLAVQKIVEMIGAESGEDCKLVQKLMQCSRSMATSILGVMHSRLCLKEGAQVEGIKQVLRWAHICVLDLRYAPAHIITPCLSAVCVATLKSLNLGAHVVHDAQLRQMILLKSLTLLSVGGFKVQRDWSDCDTPWQTLALVNHNEPFAELVQYPLRSLKMLAFAGSYFCFNLTNSVYIIEAAAKNLKRVPKVLFGTPCCHTTTGVAAETTKVENGFLVRFEIPASLQDTEATKAVVAATSAVSFARTPMNAHTPAENLKYKTEGNMHLGFQTCMRNQPATRSLILKWGTGHFGEVHTNNVALAGFRDQFCKPTPATALLTELKEMHGLEKIQVTLQEMSKFWRHDVKMVIRLVAQTLVANQIGSMVSLSIFPPFCKDGWPEYYEAARKSTRGISNDCNLHVLGVDITVEF